MKRLKNTLLAMLLIIASVATFAQSNDWKVMFSDTVAGCTSPMGMACDGNNLYTCSISEATLYTINFSSEKTKSNSIKGLTKSLDPGVFCVGLTYDGKHLFIANGNGVIYQLNEAKDSVEATIDLPKGMAAAALAYDAKADNGKGAFWTVLKTNDIHLISREGIVLKTITAKDLNYNYEIWGLAMDSTDSKYLYALERGPQNVIRINLETKEIDAPLHDITNEFPDYETKYCYGIYFTDKMIANTTILGFFYMSGYNVGYDFSTVNHLSGDNVILKGTNMVLNYKINTPMTISANYLSTGLNAMTSCTMNYSVDGDTYSEEITGNYLDYVNCFTLNHPTQFMPMEEKEYTVKVWLSNINKIDTLSTDTLTHKFKIFTKGVPRMVLHEGFTSSTCAPCKIGNANLQKVLPLHDNAICIKYQMNWPGSGDPYYTTEGGARKNYYNVQSVPYLAVDGNVWKGGTNSYDPSAIENEFSKPSLVEMSSDFRHTSQKHFIVNVNAKAVDGISKNARLFVALVEKETKQNIADEYLKQYGQATFAANFDTTFHYVMKKFLTPATGKQVTLTAADNVVNEWFEYEFPGNYRLPNTASDAIDLSSEHSVENFNNIYVVYWIQDYITKEIYQAGQNEGGYVGIVENQPASQHMTIYPNPTQNWLNIDCENEIEQVEIFNMFGQRILTGNDNHINVSNLSNGVYVIRVATTAGIATSKFIKK